MVKSPVIQLRNMIHSGTVGMQPILMQAIIIAKKLGQKDFGDWLESEYRGYPSKSLRKVRISRSFLPKLTR